MFGPQWCQIIIYHIFLDHHAGQHIAALLLIEIGWSSCSRIEVKCVLKWSLFLINCFDLMAESGLCWHSLFALLGHSSVSAIDFSVDWAVSESRHEDAVIGIGQDRGQGNKTGSLWPKKWKKLFVVHW